MVVVRALVTPVAGKPLPVPGLFACTVGEEDISGVVSGFFPGCTNTRGGGASAAASAKGHLALCALVVVRIVA